MEQEQMVLAEETMEHHRIIILVRMILVVVAAVTTRKVELEVVMERTSADKVSTISSHSLTILVGTMLVNLEDTMMELVDMMQQGMVRLMGTEARITVSMDRVEVTTQTGSACQQEVTEDTTMTAVTVGQEEGKQMDLEGVTAHLVVGLVDPQGVATEAGAEVCPPRPMECIKNLERINVS
jgi:hypothetical protein